MIHPFSQIETVAKHYRANKQTIVLVTGVFDLLHIEHIRFLTAAKDQADKLIVGIEPDERVKQIKGRERPIHPEHIRMEQIDALKAVDDVFLLKEASNSLDYWKNLLSLISPHKYAISSHADHLENKQKLCDQLGVELCVVRNFVPDYSTTSLLEKINRIE